MSNKEYWYLYWWENDPHFNDHFCTVITANMRIGREKEAEFFCRIMAYKQLIKKGLVSLLTLAGHSGESNAWHSEEGKEIISSDRNIPIGRLAV